jgi:competence protein ComEA
MSAIPTRRLFVYIATGLVVLVVGTIGLVSMGSRGDASDGGLVIAADGAIDGAADPAAGDDEGTSPGITDALSHPADPASSTTTTQQVQIFVQVAGAVRRPGVYQMGADARVFQAVLEAGGFTDEADQEGVALAASLIDGCRVYVPRVGELTVETIQAPTQSSAGITGGSSSEGSTAGGSSTNSVSLNSATLEQLDALPGIGPALAQQIIDYRETQGPFASVDQLTDVPGIGPAKLEQLRLLVRL